MRDILDIANGTGKIQISDSFSLTFAQLLTFSQLYDFLKTNKQFL